MHNTGQLSLSRESHYHHGIQFLPLTLMVRQGEGKVSAQSTYTEQTGQGVV